MLFTGTGKYSGGLWECSMIGVEDRHDMIGGDKWRSPKHHRFPLSSAVFVGKFFFRFLLCGCRMRSNDESMSKLMMYENPGLRSSCRRLSTDKRNPQCQGT